MGSKGGWFSALKKAIICESKEEKRENKSSRLGRCFGRQGSVDLDSSNGGVVTAAANSPAKLMAAENEQNRHAYSVALVTAMAAEVAVAAAHAAAEVVRLRAAACKTKEDIAATMIQTAFRGYLARRAVRALRSLVRLKTLIGGHAVKRQAAATSKCLQTMVRVQSDVRAWRITVSDRNYAVQQQIQRKHEKELELLTVLKEEKWNDSTHSKEHIESKLHHRQAAAMRRERALAYAYSHQMWRNSANQMFMDPNDPHWGRNWLNQWMEARLWENRSSAADKAPKGNLISGKSSTGRPVHSPVARKRTRAPRWQSPLTPKSKGAVKIHQLRSPREGNISISTDIDSRSMNSVQSSRCRKHSNGTSSLRDDDSQTISSPAASVPSYMAFTESARAKLRLPSPLRQEKLWNCDGKVHAKKRLSFSGSSNGSCRQFSVPENNAIETCSN